MRRKIICWLLVLAMVLSIMPVIPLESRANGVIPQAGATIYAGQKAKVYIYGDNGYAMTNLVFNSRGNTIATIVGYDESDDIVYESNVCSGGFTDIFYFAQNGYYFEIEVFYGGISITYNTANNSYDPEYEIIETGNVYTDLVKGTLNHIYLSVGETAEYAIGSVIDGYSASAANFSSSNRQIASVDNSGQITAYSAGTVEITMEYLFWATSNQYFYETISCTVTVVEDYTIQSSGLSYYADLNTAYFNIVAYDPLFGDRITGFDITAGGTTYSTESSYELLIELPEDFSEDITITKDGYIPYTLSHDNLSTSNVIMMYSAKGSDPVIQSVWVREPGSTESTNAKLQTVQVLEDSGLNYTVSYDIYWNGHEAASVYLQQGKTRIPLGSGDNTFPLADYLSNNGERVYLCAMTTDGYLVSTPLLLSVTSEVTIMTMDFGSAVSTAIDDTVTGFGGTRVGFDMTGTIPVAFAANKDGTVRGIIGITLNHKDQSTVEDLYKEIKDSEGKISDAQSKGNKSTVSSLTESLYNRLNKDGKIAEKQSTLGWSASISYLGYFDAKMVDGSLTITEIGIIVSAKVSAHYSSMILTSSSIPLRWKVSIADQVQLAFSKMTEGSGSTIGVVVSDFENTISLSSELSTGVFGTAEASGTIKGKLKFAYDETSGSFADGVWTLSADLSGGLTLFGAEVKELFDVTLIDGLQIYPLESTSTSMVEYSLPRTYLNAPMAVDTGEEDSCISGLVCGDTLLSNTYTDSQPRLARLENKDVLVWVGDDAQRSDANRTCLYYMVYSHESGGWSEPTAVYNDGLADFYPSLSLQNGTLYLVWLKANTVLDDGALLADTACAMDVYVSTFDAEDETFLAPEAVHKSNAVLDQMPQIQTVDGTPTIVWVKNGEDIWDTEADSTIMRSTYSEENGWSQETLSTVSGAPGAIALAEDGTVYYTLDSVLYSLSPDGTATALTGGDVSASNPKIYDGTLYWLEDGVLTNGTDRISLAAGVTNYAVYTRSDGVTKAVVYYATDGSDVQLWATFGDGTGWGEPLALTKETGTGFSGLTGYYDDAGQLVLAANCTTGDPDTGSKTAELKLLTVTGGCDLSLNSVDYLGTSLSEGGTLVTDAYITNTGTTSIGKVIFTAREGETELYSITVDASLHPGESTVLELLIPVEYVTGENVTLTASVLNRADVDESNNVQTLEVSLADVSMEEMNAEILPDGTTHISALVVNRGMKDLENITVCFTRDASDGAVLGTCSIDSIAMGETVLISADLTGITPGSLIYATAQLDEAENYDSNNVGFAYVQSMLENTDSVTAVSVFGSEDLAVDTEYEALFLADAQCSGSFTAPESGYYLIYVDGFLSNPGEEYPFMECSLSTGSESEPYVYQVSADRRVDPGTGCWKGSYVFQVCLEAGVTYDLILDGTDRVLAVTRITYISDVESISIEDITVSEKEWQYGITPNKTFDPEEGYDDLILTSSDNSVAKVNETYFSPLFPGEAEITARGLYSGLETTFTVTVTEVERAGTLNPGGSTDVVVGSDADYFYDLPITETGFYTLSCDGDAYLRTEEGYSYFSESSPLTLMLEAGTTYLACVYSTCTVNVYPTEFASLYPDDGISCGGDDCDGVLAGVFQPEEDNACCLSVYCRSCSYGYAATLTIYDSTFHVLYDSTFSDSSYMDLTYLFEGGETYYIFLSHTGSASLSLYSYELSVYSDLFRNSAFVGSTATFECYLYNSTGEETITWSSSDPAIATIDQDGTAKFLKAGTVTITASLFDGLVTESVEVTVSDKGTLTLDSTATTELFQSSKAYDFTPEESGTYCFMIQTECEAEWWYCMWEVTDEEGNYAKYISASSDDNLSYNTYQLEAGKTYTLTLYYDYTYSEATGGEVPIHVTVTLIRADCEKNGHTVTSYTGYPSTCWYQGKSDGSFCGVCGETLEGMVELPLEAHDFQEGYCIECGISESDAKNCEAGDHAYGDWYTYSDPTCTEDGEELRYCSNCMNGESRPIPATGHDYQPETTPPTCEEQGYTTYTCSVCEESYVGDYTDALGHSFEEYVSDNNATCTQDGTKTSKCSLCGAVDTLPDTGTAGHCYVSNVTAPTCTEQGYTTYTCSVCGESYVGDHTEALGHRIENGVCTVCGELPTEGICGEDLTWVLSDDGTLTISGTGEMYSYAAGEAPWYGWASDITAVVIESGTTSIGNAAFYNCTGLETVMVSDTVEAIGEGAFQNCTGLTEITFEGNAPSFAGDAFRETTAQAYYPAGNETWTQDVMQDYGGTITWLSYEPSTIVCGDVNGNGEIDIFDANMIAAYYNEVIDLTEDQLAAADVNSDGEVNIFDANLVAAYYNEAIDAFPLK